MTKLARNTGAIPLVEQQFFLAIKTCSRNHHGDVNHDDFIECFKITLGYSKLSFEERLENNQAIKEMDTALNRADIRFSGLLPEATIRRIGVEYGIHKMRLELAMNVSPHGLGDLVKYEECLPNLQFIINGYRPGFGKASAAAVERAAKKKAEEEAKASVLGSLMTAGGLVDKPVTSFNDLFKRLSFTGPTAEELAAEARAAKEAAEHEEADADEEDELDDGVNGGGGDNKDANVIADAAKRQAEYEEMAAAASIVQSNFRRKKAMNQFYAKMCKIYMDKRLQRRQDPSSRNVSMQIMGGNLAAL